MGTVAFPVLIVLLNLFIDLSWLSVVFKYFGHAAVGCVAYCSLSDSFSIVHVVVLMLKQQTNKNKSNQITHLMLDLKEAL